MIKGYGHLVRQLRQDIDAYASTYAYPDDAEMRRVIAADLVALRGIADLIEAGNLKLAYARASDLDTLVRDAISSVVWEALERAEDDR